MSSFFIDSHQRTSGSNQQAVYSFSSDLVGHYQVVYSHMEDNLGDGTGVPCVYSGMNQIYVTNVTTSTSKVVTFTQLDIDDPTEVCQWFQDNLMAAANFPLSTITCTTPDNGSTYNIDFGAETFTFVLSDTANSTMWRLFGTTDLTGTDFDVTGLHIDARPKILGFGVSEFAGKVQFSGESSNVKLLISLQDEMFDSHYINITDEVNTLHVQIYRINAPSIICPCQLRYQIMIQKIFNSGIAV